MHWLTIVQFLRVRIDLVLVIGGGGCTCTVQVHWLALSMEIACWKLLHVHIHVYSYFTYIIQRHHLYKNSYLLMTCVLCSPVLSLTIEHVHVHSGCV